MNGVPLTAVVVALALAACATPGAGRPEPPSVGDARSFLVRIVETARAGGLDQLCELGGGNCERFARELGPASIPPLPPTVLAARSVPSVALPGTTNRTVGGVILEVCGVDGRGKPYRSEIFVFRDEGTGELRAIEPTWWWRGRIADASNPRTDLEPLPEGCP